MNFSVKTDHERGVRKVYRCNHCMDGEGLRWLRKVTGKTAEETAAFFGVTENDLKKIETGDIDFFRVAQKGRGKETKFSDLH